MCDFQLGQGVNLTGRVFCKSCGQVARQGGTRATFSGHDGNFDTFTPNTAIVCPWCDTVNESVEMPCSDPIELITQHEQVYIFNVAQGQRTP